MKFLKHLEKHIEKTHKDKYCKGGIETIEFIKAKFSLEDFALANVIKYVTRYKVTRNPEDLLKAGHYLAMVYEEDPNVSYSLFLWK